MVTSGVLEKGEEEALVILRFYTHDWGMVKCWAHMVDVLGRGKLALGRGTVLIQFRQVLYKQRVDLKHYENIHMEVTTGGKYV